MKKNMLFVAAAAVLALTSCHSTDSAYKKAYEKAQAQDAARKAASQQDSPVVAPVETTPVATAPTSEQNTADVKVTREKLTVVGGSPLKAYSVVVGAFGLKTNAEGVQQTLKNKGYNGAVIVRNEERNLYRVVAATFDSKADAVNSRNQLRSLYPDAWLLLSE